MRIAYFDCFSGVSGDMTPGRAGLGRLARGRARVAAGAARPRGRRDRGRRRCGAGRSPRPGSRSRVEDATQPHRHLHHVERHARRAPICDPAVRAARARGVPAARRGRGRGARQHRREGALPRGRRGRRAGGRGRRDARASHALGVERVYCLARCGSAAASVHVASTARIPVPAPATALLLRGAPVEMPARSRPSWSRRPAPRCSPRWSRTGAPPPAVPARAHRHRRGRPRPEGAGQRAAGAGRRGEPARARRAAAVAVLETALDDENPQYLARPGPAPARPRARSTRCWCRAIMKKGRPGHVAGGDRRARSGATHSRRMLLAETSTLGRAHARRASATSCARAHGARSRPPSVAWRSRWRRCPTAASARCPSSNRCARRRALRPARCARSPRPRLAAWRTGPDGPLRMLVARDLWVRAAGRASTRSCASASLEAGRGRVGRGERDPTGAARRRWPSPWPG